MGRTASFAFAESWSTETISHDAISILCRERPTADAARLEISDGLASKVRRGNAKAFQAIGGMFTGLMQVGAR